MKANQAFRSADEAVSPVIGVILMVAITVVLAAVVFVLVSNLSKTSDKGEEASATVSSPAATKIYVTLVRGGQNAPYTLGTAGSSTAETSVTIDGIQCNTSGTGVTLQEAGSTDGQWGQGEALVYSACGSIASFTSGQSYLVTVNVHGTLLLDNAKVVVQ